MPVILNRTVQHLPLRSFSVGCFWLPWFPGRDFTACVAAVLGQMAGVVLFDIVVLKELKQVDYDWSAETGAFPDSLIHSAVCFRVLDFYIFQQRSMPLTLPSGDAAAGYFNVIFMPTSVINLAAGFHPSVPDPSDRLSSE